MVLSGDTVWPAGESIGVTVDGCRVGARIADGRWVGVRLGEEVGDGGTAAGAGATA